jgi:hypothetical protein
MGWRDRAAAHAILEDAEFMQLQDLPKPVAFQVRLFQTKKLKVWFVGTRVNLKKWEKDDYPFSEFSPLGSPKFVKLAAETAASFCKAFDELHAFAKEALPDSQYTGYGPSKRIGELSLGLQIATTLGKRVLSFLDDDDPAEAILACVCEPGRIVRARSEKAGIHLLFEKMATAVCQMTNRGNIPPVEVDYPEGFAPPPTVDLGPVVDRLAMIPGVKKSKQPTDYFGWSKQLVSQELNAFVGAEIAEPDTVVPSYASMKLLAQRTAGGKVKVF